MLNPPRSWYPHSPKILLWCSWVLCRALGLIFGIRSKGLEILPKQGPLLLIAPHVTFLDPLFILAATPRPVHFIADSFFVFINPIIAWAMWLAGVVPVDRTKSDPYALRQFIRLLAQGECCAFFPEGARNLNGEAIPPMAQATKLIAKTRVPVAALRLEGAYNIWPRWDGICRWPWGKVKVTFSHWLKNDNQQIKTRPWWRLVYNLEKKINIEEERRCLLNELNQASHKEAEKINLGYFKRAHYLGDILCFCPICLQANALKFNNGRHCLVCDHCDSQWLIENNTLTLQQAQGSLNYWFHQMIVAIREAPPDKILIAEKIQAVIYPRQECHSCPLFQVLISRKRAL